MLVPQKKAALSAPAKVVMGAAVVDGPMVVAGAAVLTAHSKCLFNMPHKATLSRHSTCALNKAFALGQNA